jgi:ketosteroid isomerase-like protein
MMDDPTPEEIADAFFAGIEAGDIAAVRAIYAPDARIWHNTDGVTQSVAENLAVLEAFVARTSTRTYSARRLNTFPGGFVQRHVLVATRADGRTDQLAAAVVCDIQGGRIVQLDEYFDSEQVRRFRE